MLLSPNMYGICVCVREYARVCVYTYTCVFQNMFMFRYAEHVLIWYPQLQVSSFHDEEVEEEVEEEPEEADSAGGWFVEEEGDDEDDDSEMIWAL